MQGILRRASNAIQFGLFGAFLGFMFAGFVFAGMTSLLEIFLASLITYIPFG